MSREKEKGGIMEKCKVCRMIWMVLIIMGIGVGAYPSMRRTEQQKKQEDLIGIYLQGEMPAQEVLEGHTMLGILWIPKVECKLPILEGTDDIVLQMGAGLLEGTDKPGREESSYAVLCAHSGLPEMYAFDRIDELDPGDTIYVITHQWILVYTMTKQSKVLPEEVHLLLQPSQFANEITLLTCTPYGINTHRLLVQAELSRSFAAQRSHDSGRK